jgi:hypothetical protein
LWLGAGSLSSAGTAIEGRLLNGTTGGPGRADSVTLLSLAGGMDELASLSDVDGRFRFEDVQGSGPFLVQADYQEVTYTARVPVGEGGETDVELTVYDATEDLSGLSLVLPRALLIARTDRLRVARLYEIRNRTEPPMTLVGDPGAVRFDLPVEAELQRCSLTTAGSNMPLLCEPEQVEGPTHTVDFAVKPGDMMLELVYELPYHGNFTYRETVYHPLEAARVVVLPATLDVQAPGLKDEGVTEHEGISFHGYSVAGLEPGDVIEISISGAGAEMSSAGAGTSGNQQGGPRIEVLMPAPMRRAGPFFIIGSTALLLVLGLMLLGGKAPDTARVPTAPTALDAGGRLLADKLAKLDDAYAAAETPDHDAYQKQRAELKAKLRARLESQQANSKGARGNG